MCVFACVRVCVGVGGGARLRYMNTNQPQGGRKGGCGWIVVHLHLHECVFLCV